MRARLLPALLALVVASCGDGGNDPDPVPDNPTPGITALSPDEVEQGTGSTQLTVSGSDFVRASVVRIDGSDRPTTWVSATELRATLTGDDFEEQRSARIVVFNPTPGGGTSNAMMLPVTVRLNATPAITTFSPTFVLAGATGTTVTLTGTGFIPQSVVYTGFAQRQGVTYVSPTQLTVPLTDAETAAGGTIELRVGNPAPGGGISAPVSFQVRTPAPTLTALGSTQAAAGLPELVLRVTGTGFVANTVARFNGAPRPTNVVSATALDVVLGEGDLRAAGTFAITAVNPAPGGGTSNALSLQLTNGTPSITLLPSVGAHAGRPGFSLVVHGVGFVQGSTVSWNGSPRPTQYISGTRVQVEVSSTDVATAGTAQLAVTNPQPGGGTSTPVTVTVRNVPSATATSSRALRLGARDLAADAAAGRIFLSIAGSAPTDANSVIAVDGATGNVTGRVFVGSEPGRLARSRDGQFLYVALDGANAVRRVELPSMTAGLQWSVGAGLIAGEIEVLPGFPRSVAVARQNPGSSPPLAGVTVYDDGIPRAQTSSGHTGGNRIAFLDSPATLYGYNNSHTGFEFFTIGLDASGARHVFTTGGLISGFYTHIHGAAGRIYATSGAIVDAERRVRVGSFPTESGAIMVDAALGRAFMIAGGGIAAYDLNNFQLLGTVPIAGMSFDHPALAKPRIVRWGSDGLALLDQDELFIVRSPLFAP